jgi:hypothetical protein
MNTNKSLIIMPKIHNSKNSSVTMKGGRGNGEKSHSVHFKPLNYGKYHQYSINKS